MFERASKRLAIKMEIGLSRIISTRNEYRNVNRTVLRLAEPRDENLFIT